jgi:hypothetical protein
MYVRYVSPRPRRGNTNPTNPTNEDSGEADPN